MLWGIYSAIYGEVNVSVEKFVEIKGDYVEKQQRCFISVTLKSWSGRKLLDPTTYMGIMSVPSVWTCNISFRTARLDLAGTFWNCDIWVSIAWNIPSCTLTMGAVGCSESLISTPKTFVTFIFKICQYNLNTNKAYTIIFLWFFPGSAGRHLEIMGCNTSELLSGRRRESKLHRGRQTVRHQSQIFPNQRNHCADVWTTAASPHWCFGPTWIYSFNR